MIDPWRGLALAAALIITVGTGTATAQTVIVRNAPRGTGIELMFNSAQAGTATADAAGQAALTLKRPDTQTDVHVFVDACEKTRRVLLIERGLQPEAPQAGCRRSDIVGWYVFRGVTTLVVDVGPAEPAVWVRQGPVPPEWLTSGPVSEKVSWRTAPLGLVLSAGGGLTKFSNVVTVACGTSTDCSGRTFKPTYVLGASYWVARFLAGEISYVRPATVSVTGSGFDYFFKSELDAQMLAVGVKAGVPVGPARFYGQGGGNYHDATFATDQTINTSTVTVDDQVVTVAGGTQKNEVKTAGWSWYFGGGIEGWVSDRVGIYGEVRRAAMKGKVLGGGEGRMDERATILHVGIRIHLGMR